MLTASTGIAKDLYSAFKDAVGKAKGTEFADAPWRLVRNVAISLNNDSRSPKAAAAIIDGLIDYFSTDRPSAEAVEILEADERASEKHVIQQELEPALKGGRWKAAISLLDRLLTIETDSEEVRAGRKATRALPGPRRIIASIRFRTSSEKWTWRVRRLNTNPNVLVVALPVAARRFAMMQ